MLNWQPVMLAKHYKTHFLYQNTVANSIQTTSLHQVMCCFANSVNFSLQVSTSVCMCN